MCSKKGIIKKTTLAAYSRPRVNGVNAITIKEGDQLLEARLTTGESNILIAGTHGRCIHFPEAKVRPMGRTAAGVKGIRMPEGAEVVGMICVEDVETESVMVVSENGYGKRSSVGDYRITNRGGKGVKTMNVTEKTGSLIAIKSVVDENDLMIINKSGIAIRMDVASIRVMGRATQGVKLINLKGKDTIAAIAKVEISSDDSDLDEYDEEGNLIPRAEGEESTDAPETNSEDEGEADEPTNDQE
jgi:DNA gyrase subunit A